MPTLMLTRGLPGCGKTTWAREWVAADPARRVRINRDDVRALIHQPHAGKPTEEATTLATHASVRSLLRNGWDVVCDDTNLNAGNVRRLLAIARQVGADVDYCDFRMTVEDAIHRDADRFVGDRVGRAVIERFARYLGPDGSLPPPPTLTDTRVAWTRYTPPPGAPAAFVIDIDGTLAHNDGHRLFYDYSNVYDDTVHRRIVELAHLLMLDGHEPIVMSGRDDSCRDDTIRWLTDKCDLHPGDYTGPIMRSTGDKRDDAVVKLELFDTHVRDYFDVRYVLDDRNRVVRAWRSIGLTVLQVADGDF